MVKNTAFTRSLMKRFYNSQIHQHFKEKGNLVKPNFIDDTEIWLPIDDKVDSEYRYFEKFTVKVQLARITKQPELLITFAGVSKIFRKNIVDFMSLVPPTCLNWVVYDSALYRYDELPETAKQNLQLVHPVWNFDLRDALNQETEAPDRSNKYQKFKNKIEKFFKNHLNTEEFKNFIPLESNSFTQVPEIKINKVKDGSNRLMFGNKHWNIVPYKGMQYGPFKTSEYSRIHFFYILHKSDSDVAKHLDKFFRKGMRSFSGLYDFVRVPYHTERNFSITFNDKLNPLSEIEEQIHNREFRSDVHYMAIYLSPHSKNVRDKEAKSVYFKVKELLLKKGITSQAVEAEKVRTAVREKAKYDYSLNNIAIAILAKLDGIPWQLDTKLKNELIVGVGAFKNSETEVQYIGSAFSFMNDGRFNRFECFQKNQVDELAGSIIRQIKEYVSLNSNISRLIIHFEVV